MTKNRKAKQDTRLLMKKEDIKYVTAYTKQNHSVTREEHRQIVKTVETVNNQLNSETKLFITGLTKPSTEETLNKIINSTTRNKIIVSFQTENSTRQLLHTYAQQQDTAVNIWNLQTTDNLPSATYNPLTYSTTPETIKLLINLEPWDYPYYKAVAEDLLNTIFNITKNYALTMQDISMILRGKTTQQLNAATQHKLKAFTSNFTANQKSAASTISVKANHLALFFNNKTTIQKPETINLKDLNKPVLFILNTTDYPSASMLMFNLVTQDLINSCR